MKCEILKSLVEVRSVVKDDRHKSAIDDAIQEILSLRDEKESLWLMLEEMKKSDIENYKKQVESALSEKMLSIFALNRGKSSEPN